MATLSLNAFAEIRYDGVIENGGSSPLGIVMVFNDISDDDNNITARYYYNGDNIGIDLTGTLNRTVLTMMENTESGPAVFLFRNFDTDSDIITGTRQNLINPTEIYLVTLSKYLPPPPPPEITEEEDEEKEEDIVFIITEISMSIGDARIEVYKGNISNNGQRDIYSFRAPPISGLYRFEMAELRANARVRLLAWNRLDETIANEYAGNGEGISIFLHGGEEYQVQIRQFEGLSPYNLIIGHQKETADISFLTILTDSVQFAGQRNVYSFTAPVDGRYLFEMAELRGHAKVRLLAWNRLDETIANQYAGNGEGIAVWLNSGETYRLQVRQFSGLSPYVLSIIYP